MAGDFQISVSNQYMVVAKGLEAAKDLWGSEGRQSREGVGRDPPPPL